MSGEPDNLSARLDDWRARLAAGLNERQRRAKARYTWGKGLEGQRIPGYRVGLVSGHRGAKRHAFVLVADDEAQPDSPLHWERVIHTSRDIVGSGPLALGSPTTNVAIISLSEPLPAKVPLARNVDIPAGVLSVILDALVSQARHKIDLSDIKIIVSQLGSRIVRLDTLDAERRRLAEPALHKEILARCTKV
ncbi:hypothetical protein [Mycobacterium marinum]|uniref:hypothetical protein n=1 Tax=Mycobacterium marinum TaxID=1781 RepID=UPI00356990B0